MSSKTRMIQEMDWVTYQKHVANGAIAMLPVGATEQHGPHMALSVDAILPSAVAREAASHVNGLVAPALPYGCRSLPRCGGGEAFPGTLSIASHTFSLLVKDVICALVKDGFRRIVVMPGHFENIWPANEGIQLALDHLAGRGLDDLSILRVDFFELVRPETLDALFPNGFPGTELEHAALLETSLMLHVAPTLVDTSKIPDDGPARVPAYDRFPKPAGYIPPSGVLAPAQGASAEKGALLMKDHVEGVVAAIRNGFELPGSN